MIGHACAREAHVVCGGYGCSCTCHAPKPPRPPQCGDRLDAHVGRIWRQVGRCVYCECGARLYQGRYDNDPKTQEAIAAVMAAATEKLRSESDG